MADSLTFQLPLLQVGKTAELELLAEAALRQRHNNGTAAWRNVYYISMLNCRSLREAFRYCPALEGKTFEDLIRRSEPSTPEVPEVDPSTRPKRSGLPDLLLVDEGQMLYGFSQKVKKLVVKRLPIW